MAGDPGRKRGKDLRRPISSAFLRACLYSERKGRPLSEIMLRLLSDDATALQLLGVMARYLPKEVSLNVQSDSLVEVLASLNQATSKHLNAKDIKGLEIEGEVSSKHSEARIDVPLLDPPKGFSASDDD